MSEVQILETPIKSEGDKKSYRLIKLTNGLKALLIRKNEDEENESKSNVNGEDIAAAQLSVNVGSFDDPPNAMGLAHFLEHMVHMGSEKYPTENSFNEFLVANGGSDNALTSSEYTAFFFKITEKSFAEALDIFAQEFISPLLHQNAMQREREAVDSEYQMSASNDHVLIENIYKNLIYETHPASKFECGNLKTLKDGISDDNLHSELLKLHAKYVGNKMYLAVQSKRSLDELQELIVKCFSGVKSGDAADESSNLSPPKMDEIFKPEFYEKLFFMKPETERKALILTWTLPSIHKLYKCAPFAYIRHIFTNNGDGGLTNYLQEKLLITSLSFYVHDNSFGGNSQFCLPRLLVNLTDTGLEKIEEILDAIFSYLLMLKETSLDKHRRLYNELKESMEINFKYHTEKSAINNVRGVITSMMKFEDRDILRGESLFQMFDENIITDSISSLNKRKFNLMIVDKNHGTFNRKEKYFGTEYDEKVFPESLKKLWEERKLNQAFFLENPNPFRPQSFEIFHNVEEFSKFPQKIFEDQIYEVWHKLDDKFKAPRANIVVQILSPTVMNSVHDWIYLTIYKEMLNRRLRKKFSQAFNTGLNLSTATSNKALSFSFLGYNDKMLTFFKKFIESLIDRRMEQTVFEAVRVAKKEECFNQLLRNDALGSQFLKEIVTENYYSHDDIYKAIETISFDEFVKFVTSFFAKVKAQILIQGNMTKSQSMEILRVMQENFQFEHLDEEYELRNRSYQIPLGSSVLRVRSLMLNNNSNIRDYYQIGRDTLRARCLTRLVVSILDPKAFDYLRTKEQLGYSVGCQFNDDGAVLGIVIHVSSQERKNLFSKVSAKMESFIADVAKKIMEELTDEEFENHKESRVKMLSADFKSLSEETTRNWSEINIQEYVFNRLELAAKVIKDITKTELQGFFKSFTEPGNMRKLSVQVIGNQHNNETFVRNEPTIEFLTDTLTEDENLITNIEEFQSKLNLNPAAKFEI